MEGSSTSGCKGGTLRGWDGRVSSTLFLQNPYATSDFRHSQEGNHAKNVQYSMKDITWKNLSKSHIDRVNWGYYFDYVYPSKSYSYVG